MDESGGYLRVCFEDESWITIGAQSNSTAKQVCESIAKKRNLRVDAQTCFALFACEFSDDSTRLAFYLVKQKTPIHSDIVGPQLRSIRTSSG
jgi:hypothetical protein